MISALNEDLVAIFLWLAENGLLLNPRKSQEEILWCDAVTDLGVVIDGRLRFDRQVTKVCSRVYAITLTAFDEVLDAEAGQLEAL
jgi:hypothetical protein